MSSSPAFSATCNAFRRSLICSGVGLTRPSAPDGPAPARPRTELPDLRDPRFGIERETLKLVLQHPIAIGRTTADIGANDFTHPTYRAVWVLVEAAGGPAAGAAQRFTSAARASPARWQRPLRRGAPHAWAQG